MKNPDVFRSIREFSATNALRSRLGSPLGGTGSQRYLLCVLLVAVELSGDVVLV